MTAGPTRIHPTAYFITANLLIVDLFRRAGAISPKIAWPILLIGLLSIILYQVRTCWFMLAVYVVGMLFLRARSYIPLRISVPFSISVFILGVALIFGFLNVESLVGVSVEHWGSGRIGAYGERLELIVNRPVGTLFFGTGPGTDLLHTRVWSGVKASHSDFLQILVEQGLTGFVGMLLLIYTVFRVVTPYGRIVFFTIIAGSLINNGILSGFGIGIYFYIALALAMNLSPAIKLREAERKMDPGRAREWARVGR
jgi:O-antigen ligase